MTETPNPGSREARDAGCTCAVLDNNHGQFAPFPARSEQSEGWWVTAGCPLHDKETHDAEPADA